MCVCVHVRGYVCVSVNHLRSTSMELAFFCHRVSVTIKNEAEMLVNMPGIGVCHLAISYCLWPQYHCHA